MRFGTLPFTVEGRWRDRSFRTTLPGKIDLHASCGGDHSRASRTVRNANELPGRCRYCPSQADLSL